MNLDADVHLVGLKTTWDRTDQCRITVTPSSKRRVNRVLSGLRHATEEAMDHFAGARVGWVPRHRHAISACRGKAGVVLFFMFPFRSIRVGEVSSRRRVTRHCRN